MIGHSLNAADELLDLWPTLRKVDRVDCFEELGVSWWTVFFWRSMPARNRNSCYGFRKVSTTCTCSRLRPMMPPTSFGSLPNANINIFSICSTMKRSRK
jgi:hypothetical protein